MQKNGGKSNAGARHEFREFVRRTLAEIDGRVLEGIGMKPSKSRLQFEHPPDALSNCHNYGWFVASGSALETVVFDSFDPKNIGHAFVGTGHPSDSRDRNFVLAALDGGGARNANAQRSFRIRVLSGDNHHRPGFRPHPQINPPNLTRFWLNHKMIRWRWP